jgi:hypothetical protein
MSKVLLRSMVSPHGGNGNHINVCILYQLYKKLGHPLPSAQIKPFLEISATHLQNGRTRLSPTGQMQAGT